MDNKKITLFVQLNFLYDYNTQLFRFYPKKMDRHGNGLLQVFKLRQLVLFTEL